MSRVLTPGVWVTVSAGCTGSLSLTSTLEWESGNYGNALTYSGNYVYGIAEKVAATNYNSLVVMDVTTAASPSVAYSSGNLGWGTGDVSGFLSFMHFVIGDWLYVVGRKASVFHCHVVDISTPTSPVDTYDWTLSLDPVFLPSTHWTSGGTNYMAILTGSAPQVLHIISFTESSGSELGSVNVPNNDLWDALAYSGGYLYGFRDGDPGTLDIVDVSTPSSPSIVNTQTSLLDSAYNDWAIVSGNTLYVSYENNTLAAYVVSSLDLSTPTSLTLLDTVALDNEIKWMDACTNYLFALTWDDSVQSVSISDPSNLSIANTLDISSNFNAALIPYESCLVDRDRLYITGKNPNSSKHPTLKITTS